MMWLVKLALEKRYTFIVMAIFIIFMGFVTISRMSTDIFPEIDIPVSIGYLVIFRHVT